MQHLLLIYWVLLACQPSYAMWTRNAVFRMFTGVSVAAISVGRAGDYHFGHFPYKQQRGKEADSVPLLDIHQLFRLQPEQAVKVNNAKVVCADYLLLKRDFPFLNNLSDGEIDEWLKEALYFSQIQIKKEKDLRASFETIKEKTVWRPDDYGRALVLPVDGGYVDAKGVGYGPSQKNMCEHVGLFLLDKAIREFALEKLAAAILFHRHDSHTTVGHYAVLDLGFNKKGFHYGVVLRQCHKRGLGHDLDSEIGQALMGAGLLDPFGFQASVNGNIIDFDGYRPLKEGEFELAIQEIFNTIELLARNYIEGETDRKKLEEGLFAILGEAHEKMLR